MYQEKAKADRKTADLDQPRRIPEDYLQDMDLEADPDFDPEAAWEMLESESDKDALSHQFSEEYEAQLRANLVRHFGEADAEDILKARRETKTRMDAGLMPDPLEQIPPEFLTDEEGQADMRDTQRFEKKKKRFSHAGSWQTWQKAVASICLVVVACFAFTMSVDALRVPVVHFFSKNQNRYNIIKTESEADIFAPDPAESEYYHDTIEHIYVPGIVLEGYEEVMRQEMERFVFLQYEREQGLEYMFYQYVDNTHNWMNNEAVNFEECQINTGTAYYFEENEDYNLIWQYDGYVFRISGDITRDDMITLADSLILEK